MSQTAQMPETTHIPMTFRPRGGKTVIVDAKVPLEEV